MTREELAAAVKGADVLVTDRAVIDNYAYFLRVTDGKDPFGVEQLVRQWCDTYDLFVRLLPDVGLLADGVRSTSDEFRDEIERILDQILPSFIPTDRLLAIPASQVTEEFDWAGLVERLVGPPLADTPPG